MTLFLCVHKESLFILASSLSASVLVFLGLLLVFFYGFFGGVGGGVGVEAMTIRYFSKTMILYCST